MYDKVLDDKSPKVKQLYWNIAFGLQEVDGLKPSKYMLGLSKEHIKGKKTYYQVLDEITSYYKKNQDNDNDYHDYSYCDSADGHNPFHLWIHEAFLIVLVLIRIILIEVLRFLI